MNYIITSGAPSQGAMSGKPTVNVAQTGQRQKEVEK